MPRVKEILRLHHENKLSGRAIARSLSISPSTVSNVLARTTAANLSWPLPPELEDESVLELRLYPEPAGRPRKLAEPTWSYVHHELRRKGVTLQLLWIEYKREHPDGYQYSQFCEHYRQWAKTLQISMRQEHKAGEKMFVDYAGPTVKVIDRETKEIREAQIFVAVLGASSYAYIEAQWSQNLASFIGGHVRAFEFFGGVPELIVPDNLKSAVLKPDRYEPAPNRTYVEMASHFGCAVLPARPRRPKDKAKVEACVLLVERWILATLRNRVFFSLEELNAAIHEKLDYLNRKPFQKLEGSRQSLFESLDKPALRPLPAMPYEFATWRKARVSIDYHIEVLDALYSVPYTYARQEVDARVTDHTVEVFLRGKRIASHRRVMRKGGYATEPTHLPESHQKHLEWTPSRLINWGQSIGPYTGIVVERILQTKKHPEQGYRSCLGLLSLSKKYSQARLEAAAAHAVTINAMSYTSVKSILEKGLDKLQVMLDVEDKPIPLHENVRGPAYYGSSRAKGGIVH
ncbi:MAG: IS21 family transposase [Alicyclobacillus sp.]|nr:IS21 family transposase [Alicyclobacillus sp.]